jgi:hypothetical protein
MLAVDLDLDRLTLSYGVQIEVHVLVLLTGLQKGRDSKSSFKGKGQGAVLAKKGQFASYKVKLEKTDRISLLLGSIKCFPISFNTFKTL